MTPKTISSYMSFILGLLILICPWHVLHAEAIIADHHSVAQFPQIPTSITEQLRNDHRFYYGHTSHGSQILAGLSMLASENSAYQSLSISEANDDLGTLGDTSWAPLTRGYLNTHPDVDVVLWSWCGGVSTNTAAGINTYLNTMNQLESEYPSVTFVYMTGHLDGQGPDGNLYAMNNLIRSYCLNNDKVLFDFADIESYNPDGDYFPDGSDACEWCLTWCESHSCPDCDYCAHSRCFNCYQKGKAFWWMMARAIGWTPDGGETVDTISPASISDLGSVTGTEDGTIDLTWTATGDDGSQGTADSYAIRYSQDAITEAAWPLATTYSSVPDPQVSGSDEHLTLGGLTPAVAYFVAIKATDDAANQSALSNVATADAYQGVQAEASTPVAVGYSTKDHPLLGIPRYRGGRQGDTLIMVTAQQGSNQTGWVVSYDRGSTWHDVRARWMAMNNGTQTWYSSDHSAAWFAGGLHIAFRGYSGTDPAGYRYIRAPYASEANMESVDFPTGTNTYYPIVVATGTNDVWLFDASEGTGRNNLRYWHTTDRFATSTVGRVCTISDDPQNYWRMGAIIGDNGYPKVCIYDFDKGFSIWTYNPVSEDFDSVLVVAAAMGAGGRSYTHIEMNGRDHLVYGHGPTGPLVHFYETSEGVFDSTLISNMNWDRLAPQLCVYGEGPTARLYCVYVDRSMRACLKSWSPADGWDADSIVVSGTGHSVEDPALVPYVPSSWGFVPIWYHNDGDNNLYFTKAEASYGSASDTIAPSTVADLQVDTSTESSITLSWTAPGDDLSSGTAAQYDFRYSASAITAANWNVATVAVAEPSPLPFGTIQTFTVSGLNDGSTYFSALKAVDESGNWSDLSNVTAGATITTIADTVCPASIEDVGPVTGTENGTIDLTWTATGDNGAEGTADSYAIRYSLDSITDGTWPSATVYASPPEPQVSGSDEYLTLGGLTPTEVYFVAIKATDVAANQSGLSNVASAEAYQGAPAEVSAPVAVGYSTSRHALLNLPRYRGGRQGDTLLMVTSQSGSNQTGWVVSYDRGSTWHDVRARWMAMNNGTPTWYSPEPTAAWLAGGLHIAFRGYASTDPAGYRYVRAPYTSEANMESVDFPAGVNTYYPIVVATGANDVWLFDAGEGTSRDNLRYWHTTDRFATSTVGRVCSITDDPANYWRMGVIVDGNGYPKVSLCKFNSGFSVWTYNPATQEFDSALVVANMIGGIGRNYTHTEMNGLDHIMYTSGTKGSLVHFYETSDGHFDSTIASAASEDAYAPQLCVYGEGATARLYLAYTDRNSAVCVKSWTPADGWDADSIVVSGIGHSSPEPALVPQIPSSWGFLPIWYHNLGDNKLYVVNLELSPAASGRSGTLAERPNAVLIAATSEANPPAQTMDLWAETGTKDGTIDLNWTATGDTGAGSTAVEYVVKYSVDSITEANWSLALLYPSPPLPQKTGSDERLTLRGLIPSQVYFVAIKAVGIAVRQSPLSNVVSAGAYPSDATSLDRALPSRYALAQNYPNPFNPSTTIEYELPVPSRVLVTVLNVLGQKVATVVDRVQPAGRYRVTWEARSDGGAPLATGIYFCHLQADGFSKIKKMVLVR